MPKTVPENMDPIERIKATERLFMIAAHLEEAKPRVEEARRLAGRLDYPAGTTISDALDLSRRSITLAEVLLKEASKPEPPTGVPARVQDLRPPLGIPGMEAMTDEKLQSKLVILKARKANLEKMMTGVQTAIDIALQILDERHP